MAKDAKTSADLCHVYMFLAAAFGLVIYIQILRNRRYWVMMEACFGVACLASVPLARNALSIYVNPEPDMVSTYIFQSLLILIAANAAAIFLTRNSDDEAVAIATSICGILTRGSLLLCNAYGIYTVDNKNCSPKSDLLEFEVFVLFLLVLGDLLYLAKLSTGSWHRTVADPISWHLSFDAMVTFLLGSSLLGLPNLLIVTLQPDLCVSQLYQLLLRSVGCLMMGGSILSFAALTFRHTNDASAVLKSKLMIYLPSLLLAGIHYHVNEGYQASSQLTLTMGIIGALAVNALNGVWQQSPRPKED